MFTVWLKLDDVLVAKLVSPPYTAVMLWAVTERDDTNTEHEPDDNVHVFNVVDPSFTVTVPVALVELTVAVSDTAWPNTEGFTLDATEVVVAVNTDCVIAEDVTVLNEVSPEYTAVIE